VPIPALDQEGLLPVGLHECTIEEMEGCFGKFQGSDRRPELMKKLKTFLSEAKDSSLIQGILVDGSFVTSKPAPDDIDVIAIVPALHDYHADLAPREYNLLSKSRVRRRFGLDMLVARDGSIELQRYINFFQQVRFAPQLQKGILKVKL
jgi:hypothetical protein